MNKTYRLVRYDWPIHFILIFTNWLPDNVIFMRLRGYLIGPFFKKCGKNLRVGRNNIFYDSYEMELGSDIYIAQGNWFNASGGIVIEDQFLFGPKSIIVTSNYLRYKGSFRYGQSKLRPVIFRFGCWIGGNCAILSGSEIGKGSVIAANSVVRGPVPENSLFAGNPGIVKKTIND